MLVDLLKAFVALGQRHILGFGAYFKIDADNRMHVKLAGPSKEVEANGRAVYIRERYMPGASTHSNLQQFLGVEDAVMKTVMAVAIG